MSLKPSCVVARKPSSGADRWAIPTQSSGRLHPAAASPTATLRTRGFRVRSLDEVALGWGRSRVPPHPPTARRMRHLLCSATAGRYRPQIRRPAQMGLCTPQTSPRVGSLCGPAFLGNPGPGTAWKGGRVGAEPHSWVSLPQLCTRGHTRWAAGSGRGRGTTGCRGPQSFALSRGMAGLAVTASMVGPAPGAQNSADGTPEARSSSFPTRAVSLLSMKKHKTVIYWKNIPLQA